MNQVHVVSRDAIPPAPAVPPGRDARENGELRNFLWNDQLREFMPASSRVSLSWMRLEEGEALREHVHPIPSIIVVYAGSGEMLGDLRRPVGKDDVVVVPMGCRHGFAAGAGGLSALSIQFGEGPHPLLREHDDALESLLNFNRARGTAFLERPIFELFEDGTLEDPVKREAYLAYLQIWLDGYQALLFARQASCEAPEHQRLFSRLLQQEVVRSALSPEETSRRRARDPVLEAMSSWFSYQMFVLDNVEKAAVIDLVVRSAIEACQERARSVLLKHANGHDTLVTPAAAEPAAIGLELLRNESPETYASLRRTIERAWEMVGAITDRIAELTRSA